MQPLVDAWRAANPNIVAFWSALDSAARTVIRRKTSARIGKVALYWQDDKMFMRLPSGRNLCYQSPHFTENRFGSDAIGYYAPNAAGQMVVQETFGGKLAENATQAIARDILAHALLTLEKNGYPVIFHVHDEAVIEKPTGQGSLEEACRLMAIAPEICRCGQMERTIWPSTEKRKAFVPVLSIHPACCFRRKERICPGGASHASSSSPA